MNKIIKTIGILAKILQGKDISIVRQAQEKWDSQFEEGNWNYAIDVFSQGSVGVISALCNKLGEEKKLKILDVGCGNGAIALALKDQIGKKFEYFGVDISEKALKILKENINDISLIHADAENPPEFSQKFDIIIFSEVLYYLDYIKALNLYRNFLNDDGHLIISLYSCLRSRYIWYKIKKYLKTKSKFRIINKINGVGWDVELAQYADK